MVKGYSRSHIQVKGFHEQVQVSYVSSLKKLWLVQHGQCYPKGRPDVSRHDLVRKLPTPALPLHTKSR